MKHGEELEIEDTSDYVYTAASFKTHTLPDETTLVEDLPEDHKVKKYAIERGLLGHFP